MYFKAGIFLTIMVHKIWEWCVIVANILTHWDCYWFTCAWLFQHTNVCQSMWSTHWSTNIIANTHQKERKAILTKTTALSRGKQFLYSYKSMLSNSYKLLQKTTYMVDMHQTAIKLKHINKRKQRSTLLAAKTAATGEICISLAKQRY